VMFASIRRTGATLNTRTGVQVAPTMFASIGGGGGGGDGRGGGGHGAI
jgi:hypothetical protein